MGFMKGAHAFRNTLNYLQQGKVVFKHNIKIMTINYNIGHHKTQINTSDTSKGMRDLVYWHLNQLQFKNPKTQIVTFQNMTPSPFITLIYEDGRKMYIDVDGREKDEIMTHLREVVGKTDDDLKEEEQIEDLSMFGVGRKRYCICEVPGQVPCPGFVPLPKEMTGKYKKALARGDAED